MKKIIQPFGVLSRPMFHLMIAVQVIVALLMWQMQGNGLIPSPGKVAAAFARLVCSRLFFDNLLVSMLLTVKAMLIAVGITLLIAYASLMPLFRPIALFMVKCRYLTLTGLIFIFTLLTKDGSSLKTALLIFGIVPFFITSFLAVISRVNQQEYALCRTLGYNNWQTLYEVIIVGKADQVIEIVRQNFAIAWLMITMVEGLSMSEGGIGALLIKYSKYNDLANVIALQLVIFLLGLCFDWILGVIRNWLFPYSALKPLQQ